MCAVIELLMIMPLNAHANSLPNLAEMPWLATRAISRGSDKAREHASASRTFSSFGASASPD